MMCVWNGAVAGESDRAVNRIISPQQYSEFFFFFLHLLRCCHLFCFFPGSSIGCDGCLLAAVFFFRVLIIFFISEMFTISVRDDYNHTAD